MDILTQLEEKVMALANELVALRAENARLHAEFAEFERLTLQKGQEDKQALESALAVERAAKVAAVERIDALLRYLQEQVGVGGDARGAE